MTTVLRLATLGASALVGASDAEAVEIQRHLNQYVVYYDPKMLIDPEPEEPWLVTAPSCEDAKQFENTEAALDYWRTPLGTRPDGRVDRPLMAFTVDILTLEQAREERELENR